MEATEERVEWFKLALGPRVFLDVGRRVVLKLARAVQTGSGLRSRIWQNGRGVDTTCRRSTTMVMVDISVQEIFDKSETLPKYPELVPLAYNPDHKNTILVQIQPQTSSFPTTNPK